MAKINIKGIFYEVTRDNLNNPALAENDGVCELFEKTIVIRERKYLDGSSDDGRKYREEHVARHEIIHALSEECGVNYGNDEYLVDWIAHIIPHVNKAMDDLKEAGVI